MSPLIKSGELVTVEKFDDSSCVKSWDRSEVWKKFKRGDMVLCKVNGKQYLHLVLQVDSSACRVRIGNNKGGVNGWTSTVYGIVTKVEL